MSKKRTKKKTNQNGKYRTVFAAEMVAEGRACAYHKEKQAVAEGEEESSRGRTMDSPIKFAYNVAFPLWYVDVLFSAPAVCRLGFLLVER